VIFFRSKRLLSLLDNLPNKPELNDLKSKVFNNYVANIRNSFEKTCAELGIGSK
jgi:hypothetical protein